MSRREVDERFNGLSSFRFRRAGRTARFLKRENCIKKSGRPGGLPLSNLTLLTTAINN
jgi:hypothetical protein